MKRLLLLLISVASLWSLNIDEAVEVAMEHAPAVQKAKSDLRYAVYGEMEAEAAFHPTLEAGYVWQDVDKTTAFGYSPSYRYNLTAKYNLFNGWSDKASMDAKAYEREAQTLLLRARESDVKLDVIRTYAAYLKAQKAVQTQQDALDSLERSYNDANVRYEQGMIAKNELLLIDVERLNTQQALIAARSDVIRTRSALGRTLGMPLGSGEQIEEIAGRAGSIETFDLLLERTYMNRSELQALYRIREAMHEQYRAATGSIYPRVDIQGDYSVNDRAVVREPIGTVQHKEVFTTTLNVGWTLYDGRANEARRKGILEQSAAHETDIEAMKLDLQYQLVDAYEAYRVAKSARDVADRAKESAAENYRITRDRYEFGQVDTLEMLKAQSDLTAARNAYNSAFYDLYVAAAAVERISGK